MANDLRVCARLAAKKRCPDTADQGERVTAIFWSSALTICTQRPAM
jgi:hypothetical protein